MLIILSFGGLHSLRGLILKAYICLKWQPGLQLLKYRRFISGGSLNIISPATFQQLSEFILPHGSMPWMCCPATVQYINQK